METVRDVERFVESWCEQRGIPEELYEDILQEAWVAALETNYNLREIVRAINRFRMREYNRKEIPVGEEIAVVAWEPAPEHTSGADFGFFGLRGCRAEELGLHWDNYHGYCRDDV